MIISNHKLSMITYYRLINVLLKIKFKLIQLVAKRNHKKGQTTIIWEIKTIKRMIVSKKDNDLLKYLLIIIFFIDKKINNTFIINCKIN